MKPSKKKPAKKKNKYVADYVAKKRNPMVSKLLDLKYRINEWHEGNGTDWTEVKEDKKWVMKRIDELRNGVVSLDKQDMETANGMWRKYEQILS
jgi:hypothetical protein